ncbi:MAG: peptide ABC transporter substrate-binding protein, partial [Candidatus Eremiobacteraeota bacterium]|nr:peptide ABC transporter substrate-binding protein [Candidatus Eremiobacteraeota bacterium]
DVHSLNPVLNQQTTLGLMASLTMAWLIKWDHNNNPIPELATEVPTQANGGVSKDGLTITYHLRKGVKWSDGQPFTADDVIFTTKQILNPANNITTRLGWDRIAKMDEPDKYTVVYHLSKPYSPFIETFFSTVGANPCILPKHLLDKYPNINNVPYNSKPIGIGPFMYKEWQRAAKVVMVANPNYFRGQPKLKEVDFMIVPERNTVFTQLQSKELDMWYGVPGTFLARMGWDPSKGSELPQLAGFTLLKYPAYYFNHMDFNISRPALKEPAVRQALRYAVDRATLREKIGHNLGYLEDQPVAKVAPYYDPGIHLTPFDLKKAVQILDAAGWKPGADGIRQKNGVRLALEFATSSGTPDADQQIELIRQWWKSIGVDVSVKHYPASLLFAPYAEGGVVYGGKWDVIFFAWGEDAIGDYSSIYACESIPPNGQNDPHWCNPAANKAMHDLYTHYDQADRNKDVSVLLREFDKDVPSIVTTGREETWVHNTDLKNFNPPPVAPFDDFMNVDI